MASSESTAGPGVASAPAAAPPRAHAITARRLLWWGDLEERRRRGTTPLARLTWAALLAGGVAAAILVGQRARGDAGAAARLALMILIGSHAWVMLGTPFRMYWRRDSPLLARLPVPGGALFDAALVRSLRAVGRAAVVAAPAVAALAVASPTLAARHAALWLAMALASALLLPAIGLAGGALVAGSKAQALVRAVGGAEVEAPPTVWLGGLPGLGAAAVVLVAIAAADWAVTGATTLVGPGEALLGGLAAASVVAVMAARGAAAGVMPHAVREVAAMDVQRLAHLEIHRPTGLERAVAARLGARAALVHGKDARLVRRRYPMALVAGAVTTLALWIVAAAAPAAAAPWVGGFMFAFVGYGVVQARRMTARPIELPIIRTLPVTAAERATAKRAYVVTWAALYPLVGVGPVLARVGDPLPCAAIVAGGVVAAIALAVATIR